jgi:hypothetical protein
MLFLRSCATAAVVLAGCMDPIHDETAIAELAPPPVGWQEPPKVAFSAASQRFLVVWQEKLPGFVSSIRATRMSTTGQIVDASPLILSSPLGAATPDVATDGTDFMVVWIDRSTPDVQVRSNRVRASDGAVLDGTGVAVVAGVASEKVDPTLVWNGTDYLVAWTDTKPGLGTGLPFRRFATTGQQLGAGILAAHSLTTVPGRADAASLGGSSSLVVWHQLSNVAVVRGALVTATSQVVPQGGSVLSASPQLAIEPAVAPNGNQYAVAWADTRAGDPDIYANLVSATGSRQLTDDRRVIDGPSFTRAPAIAPAGSADFVLAWTEYGLGGSMLFQIRAAGFTASAQGTAPFAVSAVPAGSPNGALYPALASAGPLALLAWQDGRNSTQTGADIYATVVTPTQVRVPELVVRN